MRRIDDKPRGGGLRTGATAILVAGSLLACQNPLAVDAPGVITADDLTGPGAVDAVVYGIIGDFARALDSYALYGGVFTDELVATTGWSGSTDRREMDRGGGPIDLYEAIHVSRFSADTGVVNLTNALSDPAFEHLTDWLREGVAFGTLYGAYARVMLAELYCESTVSMGPYLLSDARMEEALHLLFAAEQAGSDAGLDPVAHAAIVGQARVNLWLGNDAAAAAAALRVPEGFVSMGEYSTASGDQSNGVYAETWGRELVTVGDGSAAARDHERFAYFDEWVTIGLIDSEIARGGSVPIWLQLRYTNGADPIVFASKAEADMIAAEVALRTGDVTTANTLVNHYRTGRWSLDALDFGALATLNDRLVQLAQEKNRELWLTGERQGTLRRLYERDGIDLYPARTGTETCFPVVQQELDNNPYTPNF